jgi:hypothetical protein
MHTNELRDRGGVALQRLKNWIRRLCEGPARYSLVKGERIVRQQLCPRRILDWTVARTIWHRRLTRHLVEYGWTRHRDIADRRRAGINFWVPKAGVETAVAVIFHPSPYSLGHVPKNRGFSLESVINGQNVGRRWRRSAGATTRWGGGLQTGRTNGYCSSPHTQVTATHTHQRYLDPLEVPRPNSGGTRLRAEGSCLIYRRRGVVRSSPQSLKLVVANHSATDHCTNYLYICPC